MGFSTLVKISFLLSPILALTLIFMIRDENTNNTLRKILIPVFALLLLIAQIICWTAIYIAVMIVLSSSTA